MLWDNGVQLERTDGELTVRSEPTTAITKLCGALLAGFALCALIGTRNGIPDASVMEDVVGWIGRIFMVGFFMVSVSFVFPRSVITIFDLRSRQILRKENVFPWLNRARIYSFAEIACVGVNKSDPNDYESARVVMSVLALKNGTKLALGTLNVFRSYVSESDRAKSIDAISEATGIAKCDEGR
jgi:hypothetical protein